MARFDLHRLGEVPVVDLQHELLDHLPTRLVAPLLRPEQAGRPVRDLHPVFEFEGSRYILALHQLAAVPRRELGPTIGTLDAGYDAIMRGLGILRLTGVWPPIPPPSPATPAHRSQPRSAPSAPAPRRRCAP